MNGRRWVYITKCTTLNILRNPFRTLSSSKIIEEGKVQKIFNDYTKRKPLIEQPGLEIEETTRATSVSLDSDISNSEKSSRNSQVSEDDQTYQTTDSDTTSESISSPSTISATSQATMKEIQSVNGNKQVGVLPVEASPSNSQEDQKVKKKRRWGIF